MKETKSFIYEIYPRLCLRVRLCKTIIAFNDGIIGNRIFTIYMAKLFIEIIKTVLFLCTYYNPKVFTHCMSYRTGMDKMLDPGILVAREKKGSQIW